MDIDLLSTLVSTFLDRVCELSMTVRCGPLFKEVFAGKEEGDARYWRLSPEIKGNHHLQKGLASLADKAASKDKVAASNAPEADV